MNSLLHIISACIGLFVGYYLIKWIFDDRKSMKDQVCDKTSYKLPYIEDDVSSDGVLDFLRMIRVEELNNEELKKVEDMILHNAKVLHDRTYKISEPLNDTQKALEKELMVKFSRIDFYSQRVDDSQSYIDVKRSMDEWMDR